ncbi:hypothetical protein EMPS_06488 [Entomortierella parvispora]|uniref:Uncharacterized protein n=1 Tax=Entomortierella parvispora TaxID=205924 RepID=A0A9P3HCD9_9FUNG|nr:hypothetical protein EMPS_06488 [Entomortierella parvispora]
MPAATINRDRAVAQQQHLRDYQTQLLRHGADDHCNFSAAQSPNCDSNDPFFDPSSSIQSLPRTLPPTSTPGQSVDDFMMALALDEDMELAKFSSASQGGTTGLSSANCDPNGLPILNAMDNRSGSRPTSIEQTQLLSGSRS